MFYSKQIECWNVTSLSENTILMQRMWLCTYYPTVKPLLLSIIISIKMITLNTYDIIVIMNIWLAKRFLNCYKKNHDIGNYYIMFLIIR